MTPTHARLAAVLARFPLARRIGVAVLGSLVILFGVLLIVTPGPAILVIPFGLAILATEFRWARRLLAPIRTLVLRLKAPRPAR